MSRRIMRTEEWGIPTVRIGYEVVVDKRGGAPRIDVDKQWQITTRQAIRLAADIRLAVKEAERMRKRPPARAAAETETKGTG